MHEYATKYVCRSCRRSHRWLPERPLSPTPRIRVGCEECQAIRAHSPVGSVYL